MSFVWFALVISLLTGTTVNAGVVPIENRGYIIVGDSRTVGMDAACNVGDHANIFVVAKVGKGYNWLVEEGWPEVESIKKSNPDITDWTIVSNLGVNDLGSRESYIDFYSSLKDDFIFVSVNPVSRGKYSVKNANVDAFNESMSEKFDYIDTNTMLKLRGFSAPDGLHYTDETYSMIFRFMCLELGIQG